MKTEVYLFSTQVHSSIELYIDPSTITGVFY